MAEYIEREAFEEDARLRYCKDCHKRQHEVYCRACWVDDMLGEVEDAPTADVVEVRHGVWEKDGNGRTCSECQFKYWANGGLFNYCPHCGAKMDGKGGADNGHD